MTRMKRKPYALLLEQYPPRKRKRYRWSTRPAIAATGVWVQYPHDESGLALTHRPLGVVDTAKARKSFYRFNTTPNWEAVAAAQRGAGIAMLEASRRAA